MQHIRINDKEQLALLAIVRRGDGAYGPAIREELFERTGQDISLGALYSTLDRLEGKGLVDTHFGDPTPERGGKRKKFYRLNGKGQIALSHALNSLDRLRNDSPIGGVLA